MSWFSSVPPMYGADAFRVSQSSSRGRGRREEQHDALDDAPVDWLKTNFLKTELELGHCLRLPAEGPCECDLILTCPKFLTTSEYVPRIRERMATEQVLIDDACSRGWGREVERHEATCRRLQHLLDDLDDGETRRYPHGAEVGTMWELIPTLVWLPPRRLVTGGMHAAPVRGIGNHRPNTVSSQVWEHGSSAIG
jgi:hypothetical protein